MNLYLIRHTIAVEEGTEGYEEDSKYPLTEKGKRKMKQIAEGLRILGVEFDMILSSPYIRAFETAEIIASVYKMKTKKKVAISDNLVPMGDLDLLIPEIIEKYAVNSLALVGHEPQLSSLISLLIADNKKLDITLKKGGVCRLAIDNLLQDRRATMEWLLTPGVLVEISEK
jgi:phosphohistidine phosphatase